MDPFSQHLFSTEFYNEQEPSAFDIDVTVRASEAPSPTQSAHVCSTSSVLSSAFVHAQEQQQPFDPWSPDWDMWIDAQLKLLLLNADPAPATSFAVDPAILSLAHSGHTVEDATAAREQQPGPAGTPVLQMPLTPQSDSLAAPTSIVLADSQQHTSAAPTTAHAPASLQAFVPGAQALPFPLSFPASATTASQDARKTARKTRAHPYALACPRCSFVQENGRKWDLDRHVKTHHGVRKKYVCGRRGCKEVFSRMDAVRRHQKNPNASRTNPAGVHVYVLKPHAVEQSGATVMGSELVRAREMREPVRSLRGKGDGYVCKSQSPY
ncbi:hypothetical protein FA95DRAFT_1345243 [Auriscalpium vulgare]|uniref:Uncharacterized protein n=1 Tax=Auriscalpium vulgare TaxID=40419 RepID=A0ACB8RRL1_9AGAM|nr:hypothetical protein FA95DRAFT_1345243 [Auriscalpium vulgare]